MKSCQRLNILNEVIREFLSDSKEYPSVASINEGGCGDFAHIVNERFMGAGLSEHVVYCTFDFISPEADSGHCEYLENWRFDSMSNLGVTPSYFDQYRKSVEEIDKRGVVGYHVWLFDGEYHYDATCLEGVKNPLELPFFQLFVKQ